MTMGSNVRHFGTTASGEKTLAIELAAGNLCATVLTYGATLQDLRLADIDWSLTLGAPDISAYEDRLRYCGAIVGPVANRISGASADLGGATFHFEANEAGRTTLHSGSTGTHAQNWRIAEVAACSATLTLNLPDGLGGFPGNRHIRASFSLSAPATLTLDLWATSDRPTWMNLANHRYWNLDGARTIEGHRLTVPAKTYTALRSDQTPTGQIEPVDGTNLDLRHGKYLSILDKLDHNYCLSECTRALTGIAELQGRSGVRMRLASTQPGLQVYDGAGFGSGGIPGLTGRPYGAFSGIALEPQHWPDAPNQPGFPSIVLEPGQTYRQCTQFRFDRVNIG